MESFVESMPGAETVLHERDRNVAQIETLLKEDCETAFTNARYGFISGALRETYEQNKIKEATSTQIIDLFVTHKVLGFPIFILFMWIIPSGRIPDGMDRIIRGLDRRVRAR